VNPDCDKVFEKLLFIRKKKREKKRRINAGIVRIQMRKDYNVKMKILEFSGASEIIKEQAEREYLWNLDDITARLRYDYYDSDNPKPDYLDFD
jgi:hypothetical protein